MFDEPAPSVAPSSGAGVRLRHFPRRRRRLSAGCRFGAAGGHLRPTAPPSSGLPHIVKIPGSAGGLRPRRNPKDGWILTDASGTALLPSSQGGVRARMAHPDDSASKTCLQTNRSSRRFRLSFQLRSPDDGGGDSAFRGRCVSRCRPRVAATPRDGTFAVPSQSRNSSHKARPLSIPPVVRFRRIAARRARS